MPNRATATITRLIPVFDAWTELRCLYEEVPGLSVAVIVDGKIAYERGFGYADQARKIRATPHTIYPVASISKTFTAIAILQLVDQGRIHLSDPVQKYLPEFHPPRSIAKRTTIRHVLSHTAGLWRDGLSDQWVSDDFPRAQAVIAAAKRQPIWPNQKEIFKYSNYGFAILGQVIAAASGQTYDNYVTAHILKPLGLKNTRPDYTNDLTVAVGYPRPSQSQAGPFPHRPTNAFASATGFLTSAHDLAKFTAALSTQRHPLLTRTQQQLLTHPTTNTGYRHEKYGFGISSWKVGTDAVIGHGGGFAGFTSQYLYNPRRDLGIVVIGNRLGAPTGSIAEGLLRLIFTFEKTPFPANTALRKYAGVYSNRWNEKILVPRAKDILCIDPQWPNPMGSSARLLPKGPGRFRIDLKNHYDSFDEVARITRRQKTMTLWWGPTPEKRQKKFLFV